MRWPADEEFWIGVNLPWLSYGGDFGANRWQPTGGVGQPGRRAALREVLGRLADSGATRVRWFMLADGRAGLLESASGDLVGLDDCVFRDADAALDELERAGLTAIFVLFDFHWFKRGRIVDGVRTGGRRALAIDPARAAACSTSWSIRCSLVTAGTRRYAPGTLSTSRSGSPGAHGCPLARPTCPGRPCGRSSAMSSNVIHHRTSHAATVGQRVDADAAARRGPRPGCLPGALVRPPRDAGPARSGGRQPRPRPPADPRRVPDEGVTPGSAEILDAARRAGYAGALAWSALADDEASDASAVAMV